MGLKIVLLIAMMCIVLLCVSNADAFTSRQGGGSGRFGNPINIPTTPPFNPRPQWPKAYQF